MVLIQTKISKQNKLSDDKIFLSTALQNGLPAVGLAGYMVVERLLFPVTFNFIRCLSFVPLMMKFKIRAVEQGVL